MKAMKFFVYKMFVSAKYKQKTSNVKMDAAGFRNTSAHLYQTTRRHATEDTYLHSHRCDNLNLMAVA